MNGVFAKANCDETDTPTNSPTNSPTASPTEAPTAVPTGKAQVELEFEHGTSSCSFSFDGTQLYTDCAMGVGFRGIGGKYIKSGSSIEFASGSKTCTISYNGSDVSTDW